MAKAYRFLASETGFLILNLGIVAKIGGRNPVSLVCGKGAIPRSGSRGGNRTLPGFSVSGFCGSILKNYLGDRALVYYNI
jgi:hypothetical protein